MRAGPYTEDPAYGPSTSEPLLSAPNLTTLRDANRVGAPGQCARGEEDHEQAKRDLMASSGPLAVVKTNSVTTVDGTADAMSQVEQATVGS